jgi:predicted nucleic acid-binding protein
VILVDSSVWIDFFRGASTAASEKLDRILDTERLYVGDLIVTEVLQGFRDERDFKAAKQTLESFSMVQIGGEDIAVQAAQNFRLLRAKGLTVRKTIDTLIATRCIRNGFRLLHSDKDFDHFEAHLGLQVVPSDA